MKLMLTVKQKKVLDYINQFEDSNGYFPALSDIAEGLGLKSPSTVHQHVRELIRKDYLQQNDEYGAIEIKNRVNPKDIPIMGTIAAGSPIGVIEDTDPQTTYRGNVPNTDDFYALKVDGDSMIEDGIYDGDIVVIKKQETAENGQTVVAIIDDDSATLKKIYKEKNRYRLQPANQAMLPFYRKEIEVRGIVWEVRRSYPSSPDRIKNIVKHRTLDLFAGVGGIRLGFEKAGFSTVFANDFDEPCSKTYNLNFPTSKLVLEDITKIKASDLPEFDFLLGGFPCQAFSIAGYRHGFKDQKDRGNLFFDIARIIKSRKPEGFLLENVKNLQSHDGGNTFKVIEKTLTDLGYHVKAKVLNSMEYGNIPQNRERIYILGFRDKSKADAFSFPDRIPLKVKVTDLLDKDVDPKYYYDGKPLFERLKDDVTEKGQVYQWRRKYVRQNKKGVCPTLTANMGMGGHNVPIIFDGKGIRKLTPRECFRLQGFPDNYKLPGGVADSTLYKQAGNSVTVPVLERIAKNINKVYS